MSQVYKEGNVLGKDKVRVHKGGNRIDGVTKDNELFYNDLPIPKRSKINLSFDRKLSFNMGELIPVLCQECVPGDTFHIAQAHNLMLAPLVAPVYQRIDYRTYYFFVPTRLVDDGFKDFITMKTPDYTIPYTTGYDITRRFAGTPEIKRLLDYFDLPVQQSNFESNKLPICTHPFRAYELIWNEYFRDEFKQTEVTIPKTGGSDSSTKLDTYKIRNIGWEKDYFTTCQTEPQLGADVAIPVSSAASIGAQGPLSLESSDASFMETGDIFQDGYGDLQMSLSNQDGTPLQYRSGLHASLTVGTINDLRIANHLQELRDKLKIAGARYNEAILAEYGVVVPDYRIQRPEYIGGFAQPVNIGRVMQTTPTASSPLGSFAGSAVASGRMDYIHYNCLEHGYIIGVSVVIPRTSYDQGIPRQFIKRNYFDYYHPDLATLGDQEVLDSELYVKGSGETAATASRFGYQQRYAEYKFAQDRCNSDFRTNLSFWHMGREFESSPALNAAFIESDPTKRIFAVPSATNTIYAEIYQQIDSVRPMPVAIQPNLTNVE